MCVERGVRPHVIRDSAPSRVTSYWGISVWLCMPLSPLPRTPTPHRLQQHLEGVAADREQAQRHGWGKPYACGKESRAVPSVCIETDGAASTMCFVLRTFVCNFPSAYPEMQPRSLENKGRRAPAQRFVRGETGHSICVQILLSNCVEHHICIFSSSHGKERSGVTERRWCGC